jgi:predicted transcriptional regulator
MKFYREFFNNTELNYKEALALCIMLDKKDKSFKFDAKEFCQLLDFRSRTSCYKVVEKLEGLGYIRKEGQTITAYANKLKNPRSYVFISNDILKDKSLSPMDKIIYSGLKSLLSCNKTDELGVPYVQCAIETMVYKLNSSKGTVCASLKKLVNKKLIIKIKANPFNVRYYINEHKKDSTNKINSLKSVSENEINSSENVQNLNVENANSVQHLDTIIDSSYYYIKENKEKSKRVSRHLQKTLSQDKINFYLKFIDCFADKLNAKKYPLTRKLAKLIDEFFEFYNFNQLEIILDKILNTDYLNTGNGNWVKNIYHFLQNDVFIKIFSGFYDKFKTVINNVKIKNKFNDFTQRKYSEEFYDSLYNNNDTMTVVPLSY